MKQLKVKIKGINTYRPRNLEPGMDLAEPVFNRNGQLVSNANQKLDNSTINKLQRLNIRMVTVKQFQTRWFSKAEYDDLDTKHEVLEERGTTEDDTGDSTPDTTEKSLDNIVNASLTELLSELKELENSARNKNQELHRELCEILQQLSELLDDNSLKQKIESGIESSSIEDVFEEILEGTKKHLDKEFLATDTPEYLINDTIEYVNKRESLRNDAINTINEHKIPETENERKSDYFETDNISKTFDLIQDDDELPDRERNQFDELTEKHKNHQKEKQDLKMTILDKIENSDELQQWLDLLDTDIVKPNSAKEEFALIEDTRVDLLEKVLDHNEKYEHLRQKLLTLINSNREHPSIQNAIENNLLDAKSIEDQESQKTSKHSAPKEKSAKEDDANEDGQKLEENDENNSASHNLNSTNYLELYRNKHDLKSFNSISSINGEIDPNESTQNKKSAETKIDQNGENVASQLNSENGLSKKILRRKNITDEIKKKIKNLWIIPDETDKRQEHLMSKIRTLILKMSSQDLKGDERIEHLIRETEKFIENERKISNLFLLPDQPKQFILPHAFNTLILSLFLTNYNSLSKNEKLDLTKAIILKDVGLAYLPEPIAFPSQNTSSHIKSLYSKYPIFSGHFASTIDFYRETEINLIEQQHERRDGSGFPGALLATEQERLSDLIQITSCYMSLCEGRTYRDSKKSDESIKYILDHSEKYNNMWITTMKNHLGFYPPGSIIMLSNGQIAIVKEHQQTHPTSPKVICATDQNQEKLDKPKKVNLIKESVTVKNSLRL